MEMNKTIAGKIAKRIEVADDMHSKAITDLKTLRSEAISKHDQMGRQAVKSGNALDKDPENKNLQREYAGTINAKKMMAASAAMNDALLEQEGRNV